ncbi:MAG: molybdopterin-dependent oxidoreductase [Oxalobacteraceae bacterium]
MGTLSALGGGTLSAFAADSANPTSVILPFANGKREMATFPQKRSLILQTARPPQLETPMSVFNEGILTPNDAFFVRYHWSAIPTSIDPRTYRLKIGGNVNTPLALSLDDLKGMSKAAQIIAVTQCSGNSRGFSMPRVAGGQSGNGAMGNARWTGVPLKAVLEKAGVKAGSMQVSFNGLDHPPVGNGPDFIKALDIDHALDGEVMVAWQMNDADLPMLNGYPLRLIVPGYYGTYWVKHLSDIEVLDKPFSGFWMSTAYRIPDNDCACITPGTTSNMTPIKRYNVRSFITSLSDGEKIKSGQRNTLRGIAFDGGYGITDVDISADGGKTWQGAKLGEDFGKYSFREWTSIFTPPQVGTYELKVRATNRIGQSQPMAALWNPSGYMRNVVETTRVVAI